MFLGASSTILAGYSNYDLPIILMRNGKWFEPRSLSRLCGLIVRVRVVLRRTVVGDIDRRFDNLNGSHHQSHIDEVTILARRVVPRGHTWVALQKSMDYKGSESLKQNIIFKLNKKLYVWFDHPGENRTEKNSCW